MDHLRLWLCCLSLLQLYALYAFKFQPSHSTSTKSKFSSSPLRSAHYMGDNNASGDERGDADGKTGGSWEKDQRRKAWEHVHREREVKSMKEMEIFRMQKKLLSTLGVGTAGLGTIGYRPPIADALDRPIDDKLYHKAIINVQSDDFWYPPYLIGKWNTTLTFDKAIFTEKYSLEELSRDENLPGFTKYSVLFAPDMGKDVNMVRRFAQIDSHPREDHPYNLREIFRAYLGEGATIDSAKYYFQKAPDWFHSPANKWKVTYHDSTGRGEMNLLTQKRNIEVLAGSVETSEFIKQEHIRYDDDNFGRDNFGRGKIVRSDYCLHWKLAVPASARDEFITVENLRRSTEINGNLDILVYFQPTNDMYLKVPAMPAGVFSYNVSMTRINDNSNTEYPFVFRDDGPVELQDYFGY